MPDIELSDEYIKILTDHFICVHLYTITHLNLKSIQIPETMTNFRRQIANGALSILINEAMKERKS